MRKTIVIYTCCLLLCVAGAFAQAVTGTVTGRVTNAAGQAIPNAAVTVTNTATNASIRLLTAPDGTFHASGFPPGTYKVDVDIAGYQHYTQANVTVVATGPTTLTVAMTPGNNNSTVVAATGTTAVQADNGEINMDLGTRQVRELPVVDRNFQQLVELSPGITPPVIPLDLGTDPPRNRFFSSNGQEPGANMWDIDGVSNWEPFRGTAVRVIPDETIEQFHLSTADFQAQRGFAGGAIGNTISRAGTNDWHGSLFEFWSGTPLRTDSPFLVSGMSDARFVYNNMGATIGGPIKKWNSFIFGSYEGLFSNGRNTQLTTTPTDAVLGGNFSGIPGVTIYNPFTGLPTGAGRTAFGGNTIPTGLINPTAQTILGFTPAPNLPGFYDNLVTNVPFQDHGSRADGRFDHHFGEHTSAYLRYGFSNWWSGQESPLGPVVGGATSDRLIAQNVVADVTHVFNPRLTTEFVFGYNRYDQKIRPFGDQTALGDALGIPLTNNLIGINIDGMSPIGFPAYVPQHGVDNTFDWASSWHLTRGVNNISWGVEARRYRSDGFTDTGLNSPFGPNGTAFFGPGATLVNGPAVNPQTLSPFSLYYNSLAAFLLGAPSQVGQSNILISPTIRQTQVAGWASDRFNFLGRVTLDLGVRYEWYSGLTPSHDGGAAYFDPLTNSFNYAGINGTPFQAYTSDKDDIVPRVGLAIKATDKTVIRGGYSIQYFQQPYAFTGFAAPITGFSSGIQGGFTTVPLATPFGPTLISSTTPGFPLVNGTPAGNLPAGILTQNFQQPYVQSFSLGVQQDFYYGTMLSVAYVGALGRNLPFTEEANAGLPGTGLLGLPFIGLGRTATTPFYNQGVTSNYNSLQASLTKRYAKEGLSFTGSYTYSKVLGYTTGDNNVLLNPFDRAANYGPLDWDRQSVLTISHLWELPFGKHGTNWKATLLGGWQVNGIFTWATGTPMTVTTDPLGCACFNQAVVANLNPGVNPYLNNSGINFLNPAAFSVPAAGTFGNLGRGALRGPEIRNYDLSLFKTFRVHDRYAFELRGEAYNLTNTPRFANPVTNFSAANFGQTVSPFNGMFGRQINVALRVVF